MSPTSMSDRLTKEKLEQIFEDFLGETDESTAQGRKRMRILRAATELFMKHGYRKTNVGDIARRAEVAKGTVYLYFDSKAQILAHAVAWEKRVLVHLLEPILEGGELPEPDRLRYWIRLLLGVSRQLPLAARLLAGDGELAAVLEDIEGVMESSRSVDLELGEAFVADLIEKAAPGRFTEEERKARADVLLGLRYFVGLIPNPQVRFGLGFDEFVDRMTDMLVYGTIHRPPDEEPE